MMGENSAPPVDEFQYPPSFPVPIDLFVSKKRKSFGARGFIRFTDSANSPVYTVHKFHRNSTCIKRLLDSSANILFSIVRVNKGSWQGFKGNDEEKHLSFTVEKTVDQFSRTEFKILLVDGNTEDSKTELVMKGCPFKRACTIYKGDAIVAETSLMNKLGIGKHFVPRSRFRVTIFPAGFSDHSFVASLVVIYFDGRKLWI